MKDPHASSPLGYGPSSADPETGEIIMANAFIYGDPLEFLQSYTRDLIALLNGDIDDALVQSGEVVESWVERNQEPQSLLTGRPADDHVTSVDGFNVERTNAAMDFTWVHDFIRPNAPPQNVKEFMERSEETFRSLSRQGAFGDDLERGDARLQSLVGSDIERMLTGPEMRIAAGIDPEVDAESEAVIERASPLRGMRTRRLSVVERAEAKINAQGHCLFHADFTDEGLLGLARAVQKTVQSGEGVMQWYGKTYQLREGDGSIDYAAVREMVRHPIFHGVTAHEIGHTVGLRHNFSGSHDAMNYHPRYWELRDDGNMKPRAWDPITEAENRRKDR